jgi:hypothetical protein
MNRRVATWTIAAVGLSALAAAPAWAEPWLDVVPYNASLGSVAKTGFLWTDLAEAHPAKVTIYVPYGYTVTLSQAPGTKVGRAIATVISKRKTVFRGGDVVADDPAKYTTDPQAQACATGAHAAVWVITIVAAGQRLDLPVYADPTSGIETGFGAYKLQLCFASPTAPGARVVKADLVFPSVFTNPKTCRTHCQSFSGVFAHQQWLRAWSTPTALLPASISPRRRRPSVTASTAGSFTR